MRLTNERILLIFGILIPASCILPENTSGLVLVLFAIIFLILIICRKISVKFNSYIIPFILLFFVYFISVFYSENIQEAKVKILIKLPLLILPVILSSFFGIVKGEIKDKVLRNYLFIFAASTPYFLLVAIYRSIANGSIYYTYPETGEIISTYFTYAGLTEWVIHPAYISLWAGTAFLISIFFVFQYPKSVLYWAVAISLFTLTMLSQSRMNILSLCFILIVLIISLIVYRYSVYKSLTILSIFVFFTGLFIYNVPKKYIGRFSDLTSLNYNIEAESFHEGFNGITIRLAEWMCAFQEIKKRPFFGSGIGDARFHLEDSYRRNNFVYGYREKFNAHNQFIETFLAVGLVGLLSLIYVFVPVIKGAISRRTWHVVAASAYIVLCFFTESYLERQWGVIFLGMILPTLAESEIVLQQNDKTLLNEL